MRRALRPLPVRQRATLLAAPLVAILSVQAAAQSGPEYFDPAAGREITIDLDTARGRNADKSLAIAILASAVLPGAGEAYLDEWASAKGFLLSEAGFWTGLFISWQARGSYMQSARNFASDYAGADAAGQGEAYLERLAAYRSYREKEHRQDSYELAQVLSGQDVAAMPDWDFGSSNTPENTRRWKEYQSIMRHYRGAKVAISFTAGALALNRVASMAHTLRAYRRTSGKGLGSNYRLDPEFFPDGTGVRLTVGF